MTDIAYVRRALAIALRVARFDANAMTEFDVSFEGFFRSFIGIVLCAPLYAVILLAERRMGMDAAAAMPELASVGLPAPSLAYFMIEPRTYIVSWLAFPIAMIAVARLIGAGSHYVSFVVAYNWSACLVLAATMIPYLLYLTGLISFAGVAALYYPIAIFAFIYRWRIARDGLQISSATAAGIVIFDFLLSLLIALLAARLRGAFLPT